MLCLIRENRADAQLILLVSAKIAAQLFQGRLAGSGIRLAWLYSQAAVSRAFSLPVGTRGRGASPDVRGEKSRV
jgi:hypothetical protein